MRPIDEIDASSFCTQGDQTMRPRRRMKNDITELPSGLHQGADNLRFLRPYPTDDAVHTTATGSEILGKDPLPIRGVFYWHRVSSSLR